MAPVWVNHLHNFLKSTDKKYCNKELVDSENPDGTFIGGNWRRITSGDTCLKSTENHGEANCSSTCALENRDNLCDFFMSEVGKLDWQEAFVTRANKVYSC